MTKRLIMKSQSKSLSPGKRAKPLIRTYHDDMNVPPEIVRPMISPAEMEKEIEYLTRVITYGKQLEIEKTTKSEDEPTSK